MVRLSTAAFALLAVTSAASAASVPNAADSRALYASPPDLYTLQITGCGVDVQETDLSNARSTDPKVCADNCDKMNQCNAVTWTNYNGGTCWYKQWTIQTAGGPTPRTVAKTGAISYIFAPFAAAYMPLGIGHDVDMPGNDIGTGAASSPAQCSNGCNTRDNCFAFAWNNYQGGTCYFKTKGITTVPKSGVTSYTIARPGFRTCP